MGSFSSRWLDYAPTKEKPIQTPKGAPDKTDKSSKATLPVLPWQLEALLRAAGSGVLPKGTVDLPDGLVTDLSSYTLAWGCAYLTGDRDQAIRRLWTVYRQWRRAN